ncbi:protein LURP-one-related 8 [Musa acuminata AAA Group]|uniref:protein LURP-one-related 8 n=1 Tax=Musa acuminata AAA Group TaxID=214697 RepID=UPI0031D4C3A2
MMTKVHPSAAACCATGEDVGRNGFGASVLTVWRKSLLFSCRGFTVFDAEGSLVFRVDTYGSGSTGEVVLMDAAGKPLLTLRRKKLSLGEKWLVYDGEDAVNPLCSVKKHVSLLHSTALAHVTPCRRGEGGAYCYEVEGSYAKRSCAVYDRRWRRRVAEIREKEPVGGVAFGGDVFRLVVQSDLDTRLAMAIVIVLDYMFR